MLFNRVISLLLPLFVAFHAASSYDDDVDYSIKKSLPPQCTYSRGFSWKPEVRCENDIPDFAVWDRKAADALETFAVDRCHFAAISRSTFTHLPNLKDLTIDCADVHLQDGHAFDDFTALVRLTIGKNAITFPPGVFCGLKALRTLFVDNNNISSDEGFGLGSSNDSTSCGDSLTSLQGSNNRLTSVAKDGFLRHLKSLVILNLKNNRIERIDKEVFLQLYSLKHLYLEGNLIRTLPVDTFQFAAQLVSLDLSGNGLSHLPADVFKPLTKLNQLLLTGNFISATGNADLFTPLVNLEQLYLSNNQIRKVNDVVARNLNTSRVYLSGNRLETIDSQTLIGLRAVKTLDLRNNTIRNVSVDIFAECPNLESLDLSYNRLKQLPTFRASKFVSHLSVDHNEIEELDTIGSYFSRGIDTFSAAYNRLTSLKPNILNNFKDLNDLDLSYNRIESLDNAAFQGLSRLRELKLRGNKISLNDNALKLAGRAMTAFAALSSLTHLDLSDNEISEIYDNCKFPGNIIELKLNGNKMKRIYPQIFRNFTELRTLNLENNSLTTLPMLQFSSSSTEILIQGNPLRCDCELSWLNERKTGMSSVFDLQLMECNVFFKPKPQYEKIQPLKDNFLCANFEGKANQLKCPSWICQQKQLCPDNCTCYHNYRWTIVKMVCSNASNMTQLPKNVPIAISVAIFHNFSSITSVDVDTFQSYSNVTHLAIRNTRLKYIYENGFKFLKIVETIDLSHNELTSMDHPIFKGLLNLKHVDLSYNKLNSIVSNVFNDLKSLQSLNLGHNRLMSFPVWSINSLATVSSLTIGGNPWSCNCTFVVPFNNFIISNARSIVNVTQLYCKLNASSNDVILLRTYNVTRCGQSNTTFNFDPIEHLWS